MVVLPVEKRVDWKRPPVVLIGIVVLNILMFFFYQSGDDELYQEAAEFYTENKLADYERSAFKAYVKSVDLPYEVNLKEYDVSYYIVGDKGFDAFIREKQRSFISRNKRAEWLDLRESFEGITNRISVNALGLSTSDVGIVNVISHQFLHGGFMHLLGNMVFLVLTGFAVEAALGSKRFLAYYLVSGLGSAALYIIVHNMTSNYPTSMLGASGSISGVMAMYVVLFGLRKIEFFYWFFIFTGYFRAAAIIMLPAYILKELYSLFFTEGSNVAYTAHIGGFIAGAALVLITKHYAKESIDEEYLEGEEKVVDPYLNDLDELYRTIALCEFRKAWTLLKALKKQYPSKPELLDIELNLMVAINASKADEYLIRRLGDRGNTVKIINAQAGVWTRLPPEKRDELTFYQKNSFAGAMVDVDMVHLAEDIYKEIRCTQGEQEQVAMLARKIAMFYQQRGDTSREQGYNKEARDLMKSSFPGGQDEVVA